MIDAAALHGALRGHVARRSTMPIIEHAVLRADADDNTLTLHTTDTEKWVTVTLPADVAESGAATVRPDQLKALIARLGGDVQLVRDGPHVRVLQRNQDGVARQYQFLSLEPADWPGFDDVTGRVVPFDEQALGAAIDELAYCADPSRVDQPWAFGLQVHAGYACAQDKTRGAILPWQTDLPDMVIPLESLAALRPLLDSPNVTAQVFGDGPYAFGLFTDSAQVVTKLVAAQCPATLDTLGRMDELGALATFDVADAMAALARVNPLGVSDVNRQFVGLTVTTLPGWVVLSTDNGNAEDRFPAETNTNLPEQFLNGVYLAQALQHLEGQVTWELLYQPSAKAPASRLRCEGREDIHFFAHSLPAVRRAA